jgi:hypothetical protein
MKKEQQKLVNENKRRTSQCRFTTFGHVPHPRLSGCVYSIRTETKTKPPHSQPDFMEFVQKEDPISHAEFTGKIIRI